MLKEIKSFKGKDLMVECVEEKLDKSLSVYLESLNDACESVYKLNPYYAIKRVKNL